jgi:integrase
MIAFLFRQKRHRSWRARYRLNGQSKITDVSLRTSDKRVAEQRLRDLVSELEQESAGIIPPKPLRDAAQKPLVDHLAEYIRDLEKLGRDGMYTYNVEKLVTRLVAECGWVFPKDATSDSFQEWRGKQTKAPKTLNEYLASMYGLLNWMVDQKRLVANPLQDVKRVETCGREQRLRRASTPDELNRLLAVAGPRRPAYLVAVFTGLRRAEMEQLVWGDVFLDAPRPFFQIRASTTKNGRPAVIWLHPDVVETLRAIRPPNAPPDAPVLPLMPSMYMLRKDLQAAGIPYKDALGRQADFHALRHTFGTNLSLAGVLPRVAMEAMRHSDIRLTMKTYTDATSLPTAAAIDSLPSLNTGAHNCAHKKCSQIVPASRRLSR